MVPFCPITYGLMRSHTAPLAYDPIPHTVPYGLINRRYAARFCPALLLLWFHKSPSGPNIGSLPCSSFWLFLISFSSIMRFHSAHTVPYGTIRSYIEISRGSIWPGLLPYRPIRFHSVIYGPHMVPYDFIYCRCHAIAISIVHTRFHAVPFGPYIVSYNPMRSYTFPFGPYGPIRFRTVPCSFIRPVYSFIQPHAVPYVSIWSHKVSYGSIQSHTTVYL